MSCFLANIRSLNKNCNALAYLLKRYKPDVTALSETWLSTDVNSGSLLGEFTPLYAIFRCDRINKRGGGVALILNHSLSPHFVFQEAVPNAYELLCCDIFVKSHSTRLIVVYRAPSCPNPMMLKLVKALSDLISCDNPCLVMGDINLPKIDWSVPYAPNSSMEAVFVSFCVEHMLTQHVLHATLGANILDVVLSTIPHYVSDVMVTCPLGTSDHACISFRLDFPKPNETVVLKRDFKAANFELIRLYLSQIDWYGSFSTLEAVNDMYEMFLAILIHCIDIYVPLVSVKAHCGSLPTHLHRSFLLKSQAWDRAMASGSREHWAMFDFHRNKFEKKLAKYNRHIEKKLIESRNKGGFYNYLNVKLKNKPKIGPLLSDTDVFCRTDSEIAELLANSFEKVYSCKDDSTSSHTAQALVPVMTDSAWFFAEEIRSIIISWPKSSSLTPDNVPLPFIKAVIDHIAAPLEFLFNLSFMRSEVPVRWRKAIVIPIPKKPPYSSPENYRPISITSVFARTFEKILKKKIVDHLMEHSIISPYQHGFQKGKCTVTAMLQSLNDWTLELDKGNSVDVIYLDFSNAFDKVSHAKLLRKLVLVGIHPRIISWLSSFLSDRSFQVRVNASLSTPRCVVSGVPQGGVLSPVLFNIYTYELPGLLTSTGVGCCAYADDVKLYHSVIDMQSHDKLQEAVDVALQWANDWDLPLSSSKTKFLRIGPSRLECSYVLDGSLIDKVDSVQDLGFLVNENLTFDKHCEMIALKASRLVYNLFRALTTKDSRILVRAFKTYVRPLLEYGTAVFNPHKRKLVKKIESVQNSFTRKVMIRSLGFSYDQIPSSKDRNIILGLETLEYRRKKNDLILFHKILYGKCDLSLSPLGEERDSTTRGSSRKLVLPKTRTRFRYHFFAHRAGSDFVKMSRKACVPYDTKGFIKLLGSYLNP